MLVIRMQRTGRKGHAQFRVVVQDSRRTPTSGKIVAALGSYNPHTKQTAIDKEKAQAFLDHGAQPTSRVALLLKSEGVKLPKWVKIDTSKARTVRNADKRRSTSPTQTSDEEVSAGKPAEEVQEEAPVEAPAEEAAAEPEAPAAEEAAEAPAETEA